MVLTGFGGPERLQWRTDLPRPDPGAGEVLVAIGAAGVNNTDINTRLGWYSREVATDTASAAEQGLPQAGDDGWSGAAFTFPRIQGADGCGRIVALGGGVPATRLGERVLIEPVFRNGETVRWFGSECDGAFADFAVVPSVHAHGVDCDLTDAELASFPCSAGAALTMLRRINQGAGERVLVTGASGGVGGAAVQLAVARGAEVIALAAPAKAEALRALGATTVLDRDADLVAVLGENSVDAVVDVAGGAGFAALPALLRPGGRLAVAGAIAGPLVTLDLRQIYLKDLALHGCTVYDPGMFAELIAHITAGRLRPQIAARYPLAQMAEAQAAFLTKRHVGKIVLDVAEGVA